MTEPQIKYPIRGAIKTSISTSTENLVAGQEFSIFIKVHNPFEVPLVLHGISTYLPTEFIDIDLYNREEQISELQDQLSSFYDVADELGIRLPPSIPKKRSFFERFIQDITRVSLKTFSVHIDFKPSRQLGPSLARTMTTTTEVSIGVNFPLMGKIQQTVKKEIKKEEDKEAVKAEWKNKVQKEVDRYNDVINSLSKVDKSEIVLQPGNSTTRVFTVPS